MEEIRLRERRVVNDMLLVGWGRLEVEAGLSGGTLVDEEAEG